MALEMNLVFADCAALAESMGHLESAWAHLRLE
jgi:hypothetical protein